ncbi:unnamed protein product [Haemonchus placei]|uniref:Protein kinase domain-containing protein n=1 Tax=Haemonchus placei TaxID=6290 RepID=A0A0N4WKR0_HAEPC|nr:unnamed protein product [Haemonchus placei]
MGGIVISCNNLMMKEHFTRLEGELSIYLMSYSILTEDANYCFRQWTASCPSRKSVCALLRVARVLFRDRNCIDVFHSIGEHSNYIQVLLFTPADLNETRSDVTQKLIHDAETAALFVRAQIAKCMLRFLNCREMTIQQGALEILGRVADWSAVCRVELCASTAIDVCLQLVPQGDLLTQKLCVSLLRILSCEEQAREQIRIYDGVPLLVGLLSVRNSRLQWHVAWSLAQLAEDPETSTEIAQLGGISLILAEFVDLKAPAKALNDWIAMITGLCALLAQLCQCDSNQYHLVNNNGIYLLGKALLFTNCTPDLSATITTRFQCSIFRVLRILFSLERNRGLFKKVFPIAFFEQFIDIGHYVQDLSAYRPLAVEYSKLIESSTASELQASWEGVNQKRAPIGRVAEYDLLDQLGAGAFGCVYTVRKRGTVTDNGSPQYYALKEIFVVQLNIEDDKSFGDVISEVKIIKQQLRHPNIVRYRRIFVENHRLYILMDLIEGASLKEHITSVKEKRQTFSEDRIWNIVIQMVLALRYLHKDKQIVHRDLKPNNIMIAENDRVVVTDFGLAKKRGSEYLNSAAGTIVYSCPEIVQNMGYGEKADVWSFGCCVYEMTELRPPFYSQNMLALATQIVEGKYNPIGPERSKELSELITSCLTVSPASRPDILEVARIAASRMLLCLDDIFRMHVSKAKALQEKPSFQQKRCEKLSDNMKPFHLARRWSPINRLLGKGHSSRFENYLLILAIKSLSAGQSSRNLPSSTSCFLPKIGGSGRVSTVLHTCYLAVPRGSDRTVRNYNMHGYGNVEGCCFVFRSASLQPISDPLLDILSQIHKIIMISPSESTNHKRRVVEQFRRRIFSPTSNAEMIKKHLRKVKGARKRTILPRFEFDFSYFLEISDHKIPRITYEQLSACIQRVLEENP